MLSLLVLAVILLFTGEGITWYWLLAIPVLLLQTLFNVGCGLASARLGSNVNDFSQLLPFLMRTWLYASGVIFQISTLDINSHLKAILQLNPAAIYITLMRNALLVTQRTSQPGYQPYNKLKCEAWQRAKTPLDWSAYCHAVTSQSHYWFYGIAWAALALVVGFLFFWRAEAHYGRG
jgi:teichoic acid transport system permease protein